jgi:hypothetical protein
MIQTFRIKLSGSCRPARPKIVRAEVQAFGMLASAAVSGCSDGAGAAIKECSGGRKLQLAAFRGRCETIN